MTGLSEFSGEIGLFAILSSLTFFFVRVVYGFLGGRLHPIRNSLELLIVLSITYLGAEPATRHVGLADYAADIRGAVAFLWWITLAFLTNAALKRFVWEGVLSDHGVRRVPKLVTDGITVVLYGLAILIVMHFVYAEPVGAVLATSGAAAVIVGLSAQSTIKEVFAGISLNATKALRLGDFVEIDGVYGQVFEINWRSIALKNPHTDSLYIFPNSAVAERTILNFCEPTGRFKYYVHFVAEISAPPELVIRAVAKELENSRYVRRDPKPDFNLLGFTERGLEIRVRYFFDGDDPWWDAQNEVCMAIWSAMRKHKLRLAVNRMWMASESEWQDLDRRVEEAAGRANIHSLLANNDLVGSLPESVLDKVERSASVMGIAPPSCVYEPGDEADGVYLVIEGRVAIFARDADGVEIKIETCAAGTIFGLSSLSERPTHRHLAQAEQFSLVARLDPSIVRPVVLAGDEGATVLRSVLAQREAAREEALDAGLEAWAVARQAGERNRISEELRRGVDHFLSRPIFHHVFDSLTSATRHEELLKAVMAGAALVCTTRGDIDDKERRFVRLAFAQADLLRHLDFEHGIQLLESYAHELPRAAAKEKLLDSVRKVRRVHGGPQIVMAICHGLTGVHGKPTPAELAAVNEVATVLGMSEHAHELRISPAPRERQHVE